MHGTQFDLLKTRRFLPLFVTQFLGAFNDNTFKNALLILITYRLAVKTGLDGRILVTAAAGIFILPFFLFSAVAGQLADRLEKSRLIAIIKFIEIDSDGFVSIVGRVKRFAKIAGEMVSLTAVEEKVCALWPEHGHVVVGIPDSVKGERLVLVTEAAEADRFSLQAHLRDMGVPELMIPKTVITVEKVPILASGKADVTAARKLAEDAARQAGPDARSRDGSS